jgi:heat shock protein HtpX
MILFTIFTGIFNNSLTVYHLLAFLILFASPTLMILLQLALSRSREFNADLGAVQLTGDAIGLASALNKLERLTSRTSFWQKVLQPGRRRAQPAMLRTHPPTEERVKELMQHADQEELKAIQRLNEEPVRRIKLPQPRVRVRPHYHVISGMWH